MSLVNLSRAFEDAVSRARRAEQEVDNLQDLICAVVYERNSVAGDWLITLADSHWPNYLKRKACLDVMFGEGLRTAVITTQGAPS